MKEIEISIYVDESKNRKDENGHYWDYYGLIIIPTNKEDELFDKLRNARCVEKNKWDEQCSRNCGFHGKNNTEIHYSKISTDHEFKIASNWLKILLDNGINNQKMIYFYILGINKSRLDKNFWKECGNIDGAIYSKFFKTAVKGLKYFFYDYNKIKVSKVIHDNSQMKDDADFYQGVINSMASDTRFAFEKNEVDFVDSDHRKGNEKAAHFIQFVDLILGLTTNYIHLSSKKERKVMLTEKLAPLLQRLINKPDNKNSKYNYYCKQQIRFFPKKEVFYSRNKALCGFDVSLPYDDLFFTMRRCEFEHHITNKTQKSLNSFF